MKRLISSTMVLAWVLAVTSALVAAPALAQEAAPQQGPVSGGVIAAEYGFPDDYVLRGDGTITVGGDAGTSCRDFARDFEQGTIRPGDEERARSVLDQCEQAGFLPSGDAAPSEATATRAELPATGGSSFLLVTVTSGAFLIGLAVLTLIIRWRTS